MIKRVAQQMQGQGMGLEITPEAKVHLADKGYDPTLGARPLRRAIQRLVEDPLSERLLWKEFRAGQIVLVDVADDPENPGEQMIVFSATEGFTPPSTPEAELNELAGTGTAPAGGGGPIEAAEG
jgi:ATP-dependent Clp protease ATP-binding subunit ClpC